MEQFLKFCVIKLRFHILIVNLITKKQKVKLIKINKKL